MKLPEPQQPETLSLDRLAAAFAAAVGNAPRRTPRPAPGVDPAGSLAEPENDFPPDDAQSAAGAPAESAALSASPLSVLEALLFVGTPDGSPLTANDAVRVIRGLKPAEIPELVAALNLRYATHGCPYEVASQGGGYTLRLRRPFEYLRHCLQRQMRRVRLSQASIDTLSLVAYRQPISREDIDRLRGTKSSAILNQLVRRQLLHIERPPDKPRQAFYTTTERFLELLGLESLDDLPQQLEL